MYDLMVDIETLDVKPSAVVLSIGAVVFDRYTRQQGPTFYVELTNHLDDQFKNGRTVSGSTVAWWMRQSPEARRVFDEKETSPERCSPVFGLGQFDVFCRTHKVKYIWAKDPDFDVVILRSMFDDYGFTFPFSYSKARAVRTVLDLPFENLKCVQAEPAHNALADAIAQATDIQEAFQCLRTQSSASPAELVSAKIPAPTSSSDILADIGMALQTR